MLRFEAPAYGFRHEIVRQAVLSGITPGRLGALHWQVLDRLRAMPMSPRPFARLAEHAEMAGDGPATLEFAVAAGDAAASLGSHREAAFQYGRAMPYAGLLDTDARIELLGKRALECQARRPRARDRGMGGAARPAARGGPGPRRRRGAAGAGRVVLHDRRQQPWDRRLDEALAVLEGTGPSRAAGPDAALLRRPSPPRASENHAAIPWLRQALAMGRAVGATRS